ncbi:MAG TPA: peptidase M41, partial [Sphingobacterium sp.]|nr:peptidase M41 [Sphingobacterium sp.]
MKKIPSSKVSPKPPKFNFVWLMIAMFLGFFALQYVFGESPAKEVSYSDFETRMLNTGAVERLVAYKKNDLVEVEVYLK